MDTGTVVLTHLMRRFFRSHKTKPVTDGQNEAHSSETTHDDCREKQEGLSTEEQPTACQQYE